MTRHLHLSIGPVQAFVKQSRRTRDLWASSYLLSFLTGHALCGAKTAGATVISPRTDNDPMLLRLENPANEAPLMGSLPNQFTLELPANTMPGAVAKAARQAFDAAWRHVCEAVWARFMEDAAALGNETRTIWDLQINGFWEFMWVAGSADETGLLARRKLWRTHWLSEEPGDKCSLMPDFQELSGYVRATQRQAQEDFWNRVRSRMPALDLDERERLCAIAMVKRLYPRVAEKALGWPVDVVHWPSTVDMAAAPWAGKVIASAARQADEFASAVERASDQRALSGGMRDLLDSTSTGKFARLDANWLHQSFLSNSKLAPLTTESDREGLVKRLEELYNAHGAPPIYFALLLADGDRLGQLAGSLGSEIVSQALAEFTRGAPTIVGRYHGKAIYAGGDDLLAILPVESALECAHEIEAAYRAAFNKSGAVGVERATLSAAIVFAHIRSPLALVLNEAHRLLDDVAKEENGRSSLAVGIFRDECVAQWVTRWWRGGPDAIELTAAEAAGEIANDLRNGELSNALLHRLAVMLGTLCGPLKTGGFADFPAELDCRALLQGEIAHSMTARGDGKVERAAALASKLDALLRRAHTTEKSSQIGVDALWIARLLAKGGFEEES